MGFTPHYGRAGGIPASPKASECVSDATSQMMKLSSVEASIKKIRSTEVFLGNFLKEATVGLNPGKINLSKPPKLSNIYNRKIIFILLFLIFLLIFWFLKWPLLSQSFRIMNYEVPLRDVSLIKENICLVSVLVSP